MSPHENLSINFTKLLYVRAICVPKLPSFTVMKYYKNLINKYKFYFIEFLPLYIFPYFVLLFNAFLKKYFIN